MFKHSTCGGKHSTVAEARVCDAKEPGTVLTRPVAVDNWASEATDKAKEYLAILLENRSWKGELTGRENGNVVMFKLKGTIDRKTCSNLIDRLKTMPVYVAPTQPVTPQGKLPVRLDKNGKPMPQYYAVEMDGKPHFFKIKPGRRSDFYYVDEQVSDLFYPVRQGPRKGRVLGMVMKDPAKAQALYGKLIGKCARCHRTLTDHTNPYFHLGLGPECGGK